MRLTAFQVTQYKTIEDSRPIQINKNVTCLMGKNEAGKSAVMQALWKFRNVSGAKYDRLLDLPAEHYTKMRHSDPEVVVLKFVLDNDDKAAFLKEFPAISSPPEEFTVHCTYDAKLTFDFHLEYAPASYSSVSSKVRAVVSALISLESDSTAATDLEKISAARVALESLDAAGDPDKAATEIETKLIQNAASALQGVGKERIGDLASTTALALNKFASHTKAPELRVKVEKWLTTHLPIFIYFEDYGRLRTRIQLPEFIAKQKNPPKDSEEQMLVRTQTALFEWASLDPEELQRLGIPKQPNEAQEAVDRRKAERHRILESASYQLTGDWLDWWDQRIHRLDVSADGDDLELRVSDDVNPWKIPFGERSRGFQWFFSFYLTFLVESGKAHRGAIILLDEPGLHLHPLAQMKLLTFFQRISTKNQIIYSSHSMFMVDPDYVDNVRTVYLDPSNPEDPKSRAYTRVSESAEPEGDRETLLPLQAAGAYQLAQTLFLGKRTLIVEGISDYWLLKTLSNYVKTHGGGELHADTIIVWAGGTSHILPLASIMSAREQVGPNRMAVLLDSDRVGLDKARKLVEMLARGSDSVMLVGEAMGIPGAQSEDIAEASELSTAARALRPSPSGDTTARAGENNVPFLKRLFEENNWGVLTTEEKAKIVLELTDSWRSGARVPSASTLERSRRVFAVVNSCFEKLGASVALAAAAGKS